VVDALVATGMTTSQIDGLGWHDGAYALIVLQFALAAMNMRGAYKNESPA